MQGTIRRLATRNTGVEVRSTRTRLPINKTNPKAYSNERAQSQFSAITKEFKKQYGGLR